MKNRFKFLKLVLFNLLLINFSITAVKSEAYEEKSEKRAQDMSAAGTFVPVVAGVVIWVIYETGEQKNSYGIKTGPSRKIPIAFIYSGLIIGPSLGYFYSESVPRGLIGIGIRTVVGIYTISWIRTKENDPELRIPKFSNSIFLVGTSLMTVSAIYDIFNVKASVRRHNRKQWDKSFMLTPRYFSESKAIGLGIEVKF